MGFYLGLMSGTSMDAIDAALVDFDVSPLRIIAASATAFDPRLKRRIARRPRLVRRVALDELGQIDVELGRAFAGAVLDTAAQRGSRRRPGNGDRQPRANPAPSAGSAGAVHLADRRSQHPRRNDGHHGGGRFSPPRRRRGRPGRAAPAGVPRSGISHAAKDRVIANFGGIANITILRRGATVTGFDTGPANRLLDAWISLHQGKDFDAGGAWAATGRCDAALLAATVDEPYLSLPPPKSTGRELFNLPWLKSKLGLLSRRPEDVQATLQQFTAVSVGAAVRKYAPGASLYVCGGGAHNSALLEAIARLGAPNPVATTAALGLDPDYVEAVAFAWFARRTLEGLTSSAGSVTGAQGARILGGVYRHA